MEKQEKQNSLEVLKLKYPQSVIDPHVLTTLYEEDPTLNKRCFEWMVKQNIATAHKSTVNNVVIRAVKEFILLQHRLKVKDINFYHNLGLLQHELSEAKNILSGEEKKKLKIHEGEVIYEDHRYKILQPITEEELCNAAHDTRWCSNMPEGIENYAAYVVVNKKLKKPVLTNNEDYKEFKSAQEKYQRERKVLVLINRGFNGEPQDADIEDYIVLDGMNEEFSGSIGDITNHAIEIIIFQNYRENKKLVGVLQESGEKYEINKMKLKINEQYQNQQLNIGDKIILIHMADKTKYKPENGEKGEVIDLVTTPYGIEYKVKWEGGSTLDIVPEDDIYQRVSG